MTAPAPLESEYAFQVRIKLAEGQDIGNVLTGHRIVVHVTGGSMKGAGINATCLGGGDWIHVGNGIAKLDVRLVWKTDDDALIYSSYTGVLELNDKVNKILLAAADASSTSFSDQYFRSLPVFETASEKYAWLMKSVFVARGRFELKDSEGPVCYDVYRIK